MQNEEIYARVRSAGIPKEAIATTLVKEKCPELREFIEAKQYQEKSIIYFSSMLLTLPFYTAAKEMILLGNAVYCCSLLDIHTALFKETEEAETIAAALENATFIAIRGFYDVGGRSEPYFTPYETAYFYSWFVRHHQNGIGFLLQGNDLLLLAEEWWPSSFIRYINRRCAVFNVAGRATDHE